MKNIKREQKKNLSPTRKGTELLFKDFTLQKKFKIQDQVRAFMTEHSQMERMNMLELN